LDRMLPACSSHVKLLAPAPGFAVELDTRYCYVIASHGLERRYGGFSNAAKPIVGERRLA